MLSYYIDIKKSDLINLLETNNQNVNEHLIGEVFKLIEKEGNIKFQETAYELLAKDIELKMTSLFLIWKRLSNNERKIFRENTKKRYFRINIDRKDAFSGTLVDYLDKKLAKTQESLSTSNNTVEQLEVKMILLNEEINVLKGELKKSETALELSTEKVQSLQKALKAESAKRQRENHEKGLLLQKVMKQNQSNNKSKGQQNLIAPRANHDLDDLKTKVSSNEFSVVNNKFVKTQEMQQMNSQIPKQNHLIKSPQSQQQPQIQLQNVQPQIQLQNGLQIQPQIQLQNVQPQIQLQNGSQIQLQNVQPQIQLQNVQPQIQLQNGSQMQYQSCSQIQPQIQLQNGSQIQPQIYLQKQNQMRPLIQQPIVFQNGTLLPLPIQQKPNQPMMIIQSPNQLQLTNKQSNQLILLPQNSTQNFQLCPPQTQQPKNFIIIQQNPATQNSTSHQPKEQKSAATSTQTQEKPKEQNVESMMSLKRKHIDELSSTNSSEGTQMPKTIRRLNIQRKSYFEYKRTMKSSTKQRIKDILKVHLVGALSENQLCINKIIIYPEELYEGDFVVDIREPKDCGVLEKKDDPNVLLYYKDKFSISDRAYNAFQTKCALPMVRISQIKKRRHEIDERFKIFENEKGVFVSAQEKIKSRIEIYLTKKYGMIDSENFSHPQFKDEIMHIRLAADGTNIGRSLKFLNFTFTLINEGTASNNASGNYTLGIFEIETENYENLIVCFEELVDELAKLKTIKIGSHDVNLVFYYSGDWKMLAQSLGIQSANSKYPCVWCKCCKDDFADKSLEWSITDPAKGARSHEELIKTVQLTCSSKTKKYGYDKLPFFKDIIPINRYMLDMLHLFLRISDTLINLLVKDCTLFDKFESWTITRFDVTEFKHLHAFQKFLNEKCKVNFRFYWLSETKKLTWRDLVGPEKIKLFEAFNLKEIFPEHDNLESLQKLWDDFFEIITAVKRVELSHIEVKQSTEEWLELFLSIYNKTTVTPYIHAFVAHLHEFVFLYKDINAFNLQGLEKLNDMTTYQYFKGTNKHKNALTQILQKRNRMEYLRTKGGIDDDEINEFI